MNHIASISESKTLANKTLIYSRYSSWWILQNYNGTYSVKVKSQYIIILYDMFYIFCHSLVQVMNHPDLFTPTKTTGSDEQSYLPPPTCIGKQRVVFFLCALNKHLLSFHANISGV